MIVEVCDSKYNEVESFISRLYSESIDKGAMAYRNYELLKESLPEVTKDIDERFMQNPNYDFILENLQTHNVGKLKAVLLKNYSDMISEVISEDENDKKPVFIFLNDGCDATDLATKNDKFKNILEFYNYFVTQIRGNNIIIAEPRYSERADQYIYGDCHGIVYHITYQDVADEIMKTGLRCKTGSKRKGFYRDFPKRIYVVAVDPSSIDRPMQEVLEDLAYAVTGDRTGMAALKINLSKRHIPFYKDTAMQDEISYFTYNSIPPECIEKVIPL
jgi:hypothetical protein